MEKDIDELYGEIEELKNRVNILERNEAARKVTKKIKLLFNILVIIGLVVASFYAYNYLSNELPRVVNEKVDELNKTIKGN